MRKLFISAALAAMLAVSLSAPSAAQGISAQWGCTINGWPCWLAYPAAADNGKALTYSSTLRQAIWSTVAASMIANGTEGQVLRAGASTPAWASSIAVGIESVTVSATATLTAAQVNGALITNYGQSAAATLTLPTAASGYNFLLVVSTTGYALHVKAGPSDKIYLDGTALDDGDKASLTTPAVGNTLTCFTFQTGSSAYDWICTSGGGASWTDGAA